MKTSNEERHLIKKQLQKYRAQNVLTNLIPVLDNFARALDC